MFEIMFNLIISAAVTFFAYIVFKNCQDLKKVSNRIYCITTEFICPKCRSDCWGSETDSFPIKRYCKGRDCDYKPCTFNWLETEDYKYLKIASTVKEK